MGDDTKPEGAQSPAQEVAANDGPGSGAPADASVAAPEASGAAEPAAASRVDPAHYAAHADAARRFRDFLITAGTDVEDAITIASRWLVEHVGHLFTHAEATEAVKPQPK